MIVKSKLSVFKKITVSTVSVCVSFKNIAKMKIPIVMYFGFSEVYEI